MSDPINWHRQQQPGHRALWYALRELIELRKTHDALKRNELQFFYFHPGIDSTDGERVFAYCRTANKPLGSAGQVIVVANPGPYDYPRFKLPWPWRNNYSVSEYAIPENGSQPEYLLHEQQLQLSLAPFQVRVFVSQEW